MFAVLAAAMYETAKVMCSCDVTLIQDVSNNQETIIKHLMRGLPVIFPYPFKTICS